MLSDVDAEELMALLNTQGASSNGRGGSSGFWSKKSGSDSVSKRGGADVLTIGSDVEEEDSGVRGSYDEQSYEDAAPLVEPRIQVNVVGRTRIGSGLNLNARIEGVMEDEVEPEKRQPAESQRKKGDGSRQEQEQSERGQGAGAGDVECGKLMRNTPRQVGKEPNPACRDGRPARADGAARDGAARGALTARLLVRGHALAAARIRPRRWRAGGCRNRRSAAYRGLHHPRAAAHLQHAA